MKQTFLFVILVISLQSCVPYRCYVAKDFSIPNAAVDTTLRYKVGQYIYDLSAKQKFYTRYKNPTSDSLYFYGPDYHSFKIKITEEQDSTKIRLRYFGYNSFGNKPPHKQFVQSLSDSLITIFGATQFILKDLSNEKKKP